MKNRLRRVKLHVWKHRGKYSALAVAAAFVYLNTLRAKELDAFLTDHGIDPAEFYLSAEDYLDYTQGR